MALNVMERNSLTLQGSLLKKKLYLFVLAQCSDSFSKSNSSPIGSPQPARKTS